MDYLNRPASKKAIGLLVMGSKTKKEAHTKVTDFLMMTFSLSEPQAIRDAVKIVNALFKK